MKWKLEWARELLERVQKEEMPACTSFLTFDEVFYKVNKVKSSGDAIKNIEAFLTMPNMRFIDINDGVIWKALELSGDTDFDIVQDLKRKWRGE